MGQNLTGQTIASTYEDLVQISGSSRNFLTDGTGSDITNLNVTASFATSASFATTASYALNVPSFNTSSLMITGSVLSNVLTFEKGDGSTFSLTVATGSAVTVNTGSLLTTASFSDPNLTFTKGDGSTFAVDLTTLTPQTSSYADQAGTAGFASQAGTAGFSSQAGTAGFATSASFADQAGTSGFASQAGTAGFATSASFASQSGTAGFATSASFSSQAGTAGFAVSASFATTASYVDMGVSATGSFTGSTWTFNHNLNKDYVIIDCYDSNNEEIIPQTIDLVTANQAVISFPVSVSGTAVASIGNGVTVGSFSPMSNYSILQSDATSTYTLKYNITTATTHNIHVSQSGVYWVDATGLASPNVSNLNVYVYPDLMTQPGTQAAVLFSYLSGSGNAIQYRTIVTASASTQYYNSGLNIGNSTSNLTRQTNNSIRNWGSVSTNPTLFTRTEDGTFYLSVNALPVPVISYIFTGNQGTPIP